MNGLEGLYQGGKKCQRIVGEGGGFLLVEFPQVFPLLSGGEDVVRFIGGPGGGVLENLQDPGKGSRCEERGEGGSKTLVFLAIAEVKEAKETTARPPSGKGKLPFHQGRSAKVLPNPLNLEARESLFPKKKGAPKPTVHQGLGNFLRRSEAMSLWTMMVSIFNLM